MSGRLMVCGSRNIAWLGDRTTAWRAIESRMNCCPERTVIHGGASGVDSLAGLVAKADGRDVEVWLPEYERYGKSAPLKRNVAMLESGPVLVLAFWDGKSTGTAHALREARLRGIRRWVVKPPGSAPLP